MKLEVAYGTLISDVSYKCISVSYPTWLRLCGNLQHILKEAVLELATPPHRERRAPKDANVNNFNPSAWIGLGKKYIDSELPDSVTELKSTLLDIHGS